MSSGKVFAITGNKGFVVSLSRGEEIVPIEDVTTLQYLMQLLSYEGVPLEQSVHKFQTRHMFRRANGVLFRVEIDDVIEFKLVDLSPVLPEKLCFN